MYMAFYLIFWRKKIGEKAARKILVKYTAHKMLVKLRPGEDFVALLPQNSFANCCLTRIRCRVLQ